MSFDHGALCRVAWLALIPACGPAVKPSSPPAEPGPITQGVAPPRAAPSGRRVVLGEMCPQGAGGRPAVAPLVMRSIGWTDETSEVAAPVERGTVPRFFVYGVDGQPAGAFDTLGLVEVGPGQPVATGTYVGASPCTYGGTTADSRTEDPACRQATRGCGIAVGEITTVDEPADKAELTTGGACMAGNELAVDIDGDGRVEMFPITGALDGIRAPAAEWTASPTSTATCKPTFQIYGLKLAPEPRPGKPPDKGLVVVDVLGVIDFDGDGRREVVLAMRFPTVRTIVVYTATATPQRLELAGEAPGLAR